MGNTLEKAYNPKDFEDRWYKYWMEKDKFQAKVDHEKERFSLVMPPPNITGSLHIGHALDQTLQDIVVRYKRMLGHETLWVPGTDHASIATHAKIEEMLSEEGTSRWELGREKFLERAWEWREKYGHIITDQVKKMGSSCDWSRERFTMDERCSKAVVEVFVDLYEKGLIYKGDYMVNFCPTCKTVISDIEVEHEEEDSHLWHIKYPVENSSSFIEVATTRPETMLGDTAVAVHPDDERYKDLVGRNAILPIISRKIPIIADNHVDPAFGTGAVKVTPAHDINDFEMGKDHGLLSITVIGSDGNMTEHAGKYAGMERYRCREKIEEELKSLGLLTKKEPYRHAVGHCHRCDTTVEPMVSLQWYVRMKPLAEPALKAVRDGEIKFVPERFTKIYENWMENVRDWCISRQLWWGHRIPAWYCEDCGEMIVAKDTPTTCPKCKGSLRQDEDVLDTWFSSALWPFSTLGWPEDTEDLRYFFPTNVLVTGYDIIFFWVARMIFSSLEQLKKPPFSHVVIHGMVRDALGRKMSKSLGNGIDPLEVIDEYGADALRLSLVLGTAMGNDMRLSPEKVEGNRNFCNKLWNAARYVLMNIEGVDTERQSPPKGLASKWILARLEKTVQTVNASMEIFEMGEALNSITNFLWDEFCDWYIEFSKIDLKDEELSDEAKHTLYFVLKNSLALLHPFAPFITEEIWSHLPGKKEDLIESPYPASRHAVSLDAENEMDKLIEAIKTIRYMRSEVNIPSGKKAKVLLKSDDISFWHKNTLYVEEIAWADPFSVYSEDTHLPESEKALTGVVKGGQVYLPLSGLIDLDKETARLEKNLFELEKDLKRTGDRLKNDEFLSKAPKEIVDAQRKRFLENEEKARKLKERLAVLTRAR